MRLKISESKNSLSFYVIKDVYNNGNQTTKIVETLGTEKVVREKAGGRDPQEWAKEYIAKLNKKEKESKRKVIIERHQSKLITKGEQHSYNGGYREFDTWIDKKSSQAL